MKQIITSVFFDILSYTIGNIIFVFLNLIIITARVYKLRLAEVKFLSCFRMQYTRARDNFRQIIRSAKFEFFGSKFQNTSIKKTWREL